MTTDEALGNHFPSYLCDAEQVHLKKALKEFNENSKLINFLASPTSDSLQGDCIENMTIYDYNREINNARVMIISNSCDIDPSNGRVLPLNCLVAPIINLDKLYKGLLSTGVPEKRLNQFIEDIEKNRLSNTFYLPLNGSDKGYAVFFDKSTSIPTNILTNATKIKSLTLFGFYFLIFKLSVNFCRMHEKVHRSLGLDDDINNKVKH